MVVLLLVLGGCLFAGDVYRQRYDELDDDDLDGWSSDAGDCDDDDALRFPGNAEVCDEVDNDCDEAVDEDVDTVLGYADIDGDGFGDADAPVVGCTGAAVADATDCADDDAGVYPGADETCDGVDEDCDGETDEEPLDPASGYPDADGDGFGDASAAVVTRCDGSGLVATADDCDDTSAWVFPGAPERLDGEVNDCANPAPKDEVDIASAVLTFSGADRLGTAVWGPGDLDGDGVADVALASADTVYLFLGPLVSAGVEGAHTTLHGFEGGLLAGRDIDGDLVADVAYGGADGVVLVDGDTRGDHAPAAWLTEVDRPLWLDSEGLVAASGAAVVAWGLPVGEPIVQAGVVGVGAATRGDTDGDGIAELWVGVAGRGAVWAFEGGGVVAEADAARSIVDAEAGSEFGAAIAYVGDTDGDGKGDLLVGAPGADGSGDNDGAAYLFVGGEATAAAARAGFPGRTADARGGTTVASAGDLDMDGYTDFWIGGPERQASLGYFSSFALQFGPRVGVVTFRTRDGLVSSEEFGAEIGASLALVPGTEGLLVGAPGLGTSHFFETGFGD